MIRHASKTLRTSIYALAFALLVLPGAAFAHPGHETAGAVQGFMHPFTGLDHIVAMLLVGLFAFQLGGRALWSLPLAFLAAMAVGGFMGAGGPGGVIVEIGIALSVITLGAAVLLNVKAPIAVATAMVGLFAIFHGFAHGAEMPASVQAIYYGIGFMAGSALLIGLGIGSGIVLDAARRANPSRVRGRG